MIAHPGTSRAEPQVITPSGAGGPEAQMIAFTSAGGAMALAITPLCAGRSVALVVADAVGFLIQRVALDASWDTSDLSQRDFLI